jgi:hypothetical protein
MAGDDEDARADNGADAERDQMHHAQRGIELTRWRGILE